MLKLVNLVAEHMVITSAQIAACPKLSFLPSHYRSDGTCKCGDPDFWVASLIATKILYLTYGGGWLIEYPVLYPDGRIAYDWPERIPEAAKQLVRRAYNLIQD